MASVPNEMGNAQEPSLSQKPSIQARSRSIGAWAFPIAAFFGAFLLFTLEPLIAKSLMPLLGGAPAVWLTASAFFQMALLGGYIYAHASCAKLGNWRQVRIHALILALVAVFAPIALPTVAPSSSENPAIWQWVWMALVVGPCFICLSATAPLLQRWYVDMGQADSKHPYRLYAASNLGSFIGLAAFPFLLEPRFGLSEQTTLWRIGFIVQIALMLAAGFQLPKVAIHEAHNSEENPKWKTIVTWAVLAAIPSSLTLGLTQYITGEVVSAPALWAVPLALYLLSFVAAFSGSGAAWLRVGRALMPFFVVATVIILALPIKRPMTAVLCVHAMTMFFVALVCHGEIARRKPVGEHATIYMLWISIGGVAGALFNTFLAPQIFGTYIEYPLVLFLSVLALPFLKRPSATSMLYDIAFGAAVVVFAIGCVLLDRNFGLTSSVTAKQMIFMAAGLAVVLAAKHPTRLLLGMLGLLLAGIITGPKDSPPLSRSRTYFGVATVDDEGGARRLQHGTILHGLQHLDPKHRDTPLSYYFPTGPFGQSYHAIGLGSSGRVAVVGLGAGSLAAYASPGQQWDFYEIDPEIARIAQDPSLFTFISNSKGKTNVVVGDGRLELAKSEGNYDIIVLDAYSSDSVPVHLMTIEAVQLYLKKLKPNGLLAFHVSNRYFRLENALQKITETLHLHAAHQIDDERTAEESVVGKMSSDWYVVSPDIATIEKVRSNGKWKSVSAPQNVNVWTDDRNWVFEVFKGFDSRD